MKIPNTTTRARKRTSVRERVGLRIDQQYIREIRAKWVLSLSYLTGGGVVFCNDQPSTRSEVFLFVSPEEFFCRFKLAVGIATKHHALGSNSIESEHLVLHIPCWQIEYLGHVFYM